MQFGKSVNRFSAHLFTKFKNTVEIHVFNVRKMTYLIIGGKCPLNYKGKVSQLSSLFKFYGTLVHDFVLKKMFELIICFILLKSSVKALQKQASMNTQKIKTGMFSVSLQS